MAMPKKMEISIGMRFGSQTIIGKEWDNNKHEALYVCRCDCGVISRRHTGSLYKLKPTSKCKNCLRIEKNKKEREEYEKYNSDSIIGQRFGHLVVIDIEKCEEPSLVMWKCRCDCGNEAYLKAKMVLNGHYTSCGCKKYSKAVENERLHTIWVRMRHRCYNPNNHKYKSYGAKGVKVCDEWNNSYKAFKKWAYANGYHDEPENMNVQDKLSIERIDVFGDYEPSNCTWIPLKYQNRNMRVHPNPDLYKEI